MTRRYLTRNSRPNVHFAPAASPRLVSTEYSRRGRGAAAKTVFASPSSVGRRYDEVPYRVLCFLTSYINYGGRVTDYIDIRTIDVIMKSFYKPEIFEKDYPFDSSGTYKSIEADPEAPHASYMDYIETLPLTAGPSIFGMHENANISCAFAEAFGMFDTLLSLEASGGGGGGGGNDDLIAREVEDITEKLSKRGLFDIQGIQMQYCGRAEIRETKSVFG